MDKLIERERELAVVEGLLERRGEVLLVEAAAGAGKTSILRAACGRADALGYDVVVAHGSELEAGFAFGVVRQLFERRVAAADPDALLDGPAAAARPLLLGQPPETSDHDTSFAVLHALYWLASNLAARRPLLIAVDDAHWADEPSLRWLAYLAARLEGLALALLVAARPAQPGATGAAPAALRAAASTILRPALLSEGATGVLVRAALGDRCSDEVAAAAWTSTGGNPLYLTELLRAVRREHRAPGALEAGAFLAGGREEIARLVLARVPRDDPAALRLAQALAVVGDGCELRQAAAVAGVPMADALRLAAGFVARDVLAVDDPPRFTHPIVRDAVEASLDTAKRDAAHRRAARVLYDDHVPSGQVAAHLIGVRPAGDAWVLGRLRDAAHEAMQSGAPGAAAGLLRRALAEPPAPAERSAVLRATARAEVSAGQATACLHLEEALALAGDAHERAELALEVGEAYAALFRWTDAVDVIEPALAELGGADDALAARLEGELVVCGLHDARRAAHVAPVLRRLSSRSVVQGQAEPRAVARGMSMVLAGRAADEAAAPLEAALARADARAESWDTRAALLWSLVVAERFAAVRAALEPMVAEGHRSGSARGLVAVYSTLGLLELRLGALPEADAAARVALRVLQEGDFAPGLAFAATVLAEVAVAAGELAEASALLALLPQDGWPAGVGTVLIPAARARLRLAQGRPADALADFEACAAMFTTELWGIEMRDVGYVHARSGAAQALLRLGELERARELARAELADVRAFGTPRALGVALRVAGLAEGGDAGLDLLRKSALALGSSPALLERACSLTELGAALRRAGRRAAAREPLAEALDLAARCGASPLAARAREELRATGARPRREWRTGVDALTPTELRIARLAAVGRTNRAIAQELYVTLKTVEGHLSRAYAKLGIEGRGGLADALEGEKTRVGTP